MFERAQGHRGVRHDVIPLKPRLIDQTRTRSTVEHLSPFQANAEDERNQFALIGTCIYTV